MQKRWIQFRIPLQGFTFSSEGKKIQHFGFVMTSFFFFLTYLNMEGMYEMSYVTVQAESISCPSDGDIAILAQTSGGYSSVLLQRVV